MQYFKQGPSVIETYPANHAISVAVDVQITVLFDSDVSKSSIAGNVFLYDHNGKQIDCRITYVDKLLTLSPRGNLDGNGSFKVVVKGDNDPDNASAPKGITNPLGYPMLGDYEFTFATFSQEEALEDVINGVPNNIIIEEQPILKFDVTSVTGNVVESIRLQVSESNTFDVIEWEGEVAYSTEVKENGVSPNVVLPDGTYYWRAQVIGEASDGNWSDTFQFNINTVLPSTVVDEDTVSLDPAFPESWDMLEPNIISVYPKDGFTNISTKLKTITVVFDQIIPSEQLKSSMVTLTGESVDGDDTNTSHGEVSVSLDVAYDHTLNTTTLIVTLPTLTGGAS